MSDAVATLLRWLAAQEPGSHVIISCAHAQPIQPKRHVISVVWNECLAHASDGVVAQMLAVGAHTVYVHPCPENLSALEHKIAIWESLTPERVCRYEASDKRRLRAGTTLKLNDMPLPRRAILGLSISCPLDLTSDDQERTLAALVLLGVSDLDALPLHAPLGIELQATGCTMCGVCVKACPHDALNIAGASPSSTSKDTLWHNHRACRGCLSCVDLCPVDALEVTGPSSWSTLTTKPQQQLVSRQTRACVQCGATFVTRDTELCPLCTYRQDHPFESVPMELMRSLIGENLD
ncbi:4Fe-4S dicluster domain-containing protein [Arcanobacterium buesumense]|uniref:4Fe-4S binding protein n=1 Tax=Arcanobacterium buesumense TaxID=2722751 RepID=A0A6H2EM79_9ACTO|nr:4Fe-4S binding protein [Arcanobacterium buesumense]QJC22185.1 4Fe-4S binding protein [Arcanobacterium buesumense]